MSKSKSTTTSNNVQLAISKSINAIVTKRDAFVKAVEVHNNLTQEVLENFNLTMASKNQELEELDAQVKYKKKQSQIETDQWLQEYRYEGALKYLKEKGEVPIAQSELDAMEERKKNFKTEIDATIKKERDRSTRELKSTVERSQLEHKAQTAIIQATLDQQKKEIENLQRVIENQKGEISAQRLLTQQVAEAGRHVPITQSFGK